MIFTGTIYLVLFLAACQKNKHDPLDNSKDIDDLVIADDFNWSTSQSIKLQISNNESGLIRITSEDGSIIYHKSYYNKIEEYHTITLNLASHIKNIKINGQRFEITGNNMFIDLSGKFINHKNYKEFKIFIDGLVSHWHFDENQGNIASDSEGSNDGEITGAEWVPGINGSALDYNGENGQTRIPYSDELDITDNSISHSLWFKLDHVGDDGSLLFHRTKYILRIDKLGKMLFGLYNPGWSHANIGWENRIIDTDWHHLVSTYDGSKMKIYLDGQLYGNTNTSGNIKSSSSDVYIGNQSSINFFDGIIDEVSIYDKALTQAEVTQLYTSTPDPGNGSDDIISHWKLDENNGVSAFDSENGNDGVITGASWETGINGSCLDFDGQDDYIIIPNAENLNPTSELTIMAWAKTNENKTAKIAQKGDWDGHGIKQDKWSGWHGEIRLANNNSHSINWQNGIPVFGEWYHLAVTYNGSILKLFINGQLKNSKAISGILKVNNRTFSIGSDNGAQKYFNGSIDDVRFYASALSQTEIQTIYNNQGNNTTDTDGDGIQDDNDDYPNDPGRAFANYYPASGYESLAFEDLWPGKGDYDFNDLVLDYRFTMITNAQNKLSDVNGTFIVRAIGAGFSNGFGFQLGNENIQEEDMEVSGYILTESYISLAESGCETGQNKPTIIVFDNAKEILPSAGGFGVNVDPAAPYVQPDTLNIQILFSNLNYDLEDLNIASFNPFLIIDGLRGKEIHLPGFEPTSLADASYFGTMNDNTNPNLGIYYKTSNNLPWGLRISQSFDYTREKATIISAYLHFAEWAESSGSLYPDWYMDINAYRNKDYLYLISK
ncbi:MAG: LruC domain-containing protein [Bacteroidales bacterium]|nr:LruC domain-containing protein [Bacteroidales bacterium]